MDLLIDGNALLNVITNVVVYSIRNNNNFDMSFIVVDGKTILKDSSKQFFRNFTLKYITSIISPMRHALNNVYIALDATSWRKYYIEKYFQRHTEVPGFTYKGHRKVDDAKKELFMFFDYFKDEILPELLALDGMHTIRVKGAEGDDILAVLDDMITIDKVIWTVDSDINQFVKYDGTYTIVMGPKSKNKLRRLILPKGYDKSTSMLDFSVDNYGLSQFVTYLVSEKEYEAIVIEPNEFTMRKIIMGDLKSDNIPGIYVKISKTGKRMGITDAKADKILEELAAKFEKNRWLELIDSKDQDMISAVTEITAAVVGVSSKEEKQEISDCFELNSRLIRLSMPMIPGELVDMIKYKFNELDRSKKFNYHAYLDYAYINEP
jgi:hypothetical protein